jgi:hypothetical protein
MRPRPPYLATLLLETLVPDNEALHGDLEEEYVRGRGRTWYWRQVMAAIAVQGPLAVRARGLMVAENLITGLITLLLVGFYAVFVVNVTDWLLRFEGVQMLARLPNALGPFNGLACVLTFGLGLANGKLIATRHRVHRILSIITFGGTTMLCASIALKAVSVAAGANVFLPELVSQVTVTASFVIGLMGGVSAVGIRPPLVLLGLARPRA